MFDVFSVSFFLLTTDGLILPQSQSVSFLSFENSGFKDFPTQKHSFICPFCLPLASCLPSSLPSRFSLPPPSKTLNAMGLAEQGTSN